MSRARLSPLAICRKQNSGVLTKNPPPASTTDRSGSDSHLCPRTLLVCARASGVPTSACTGRVHPAGRRLPPDRRGFSCERIAFRACAVASRRCFDPRRKRGPTVRQYCTADSYPIITSMHSWYDFLAEILRYVMYASAKNVPHELPTAFRLIGKFLRTYRRVSAGKKITYLGFSAIFGHAAAENAGDARKGADEPRASCAASSRGTASVVWQHAAAPPAARTTRNPQRPPPSPTLPSARKRPDHRPGRSERLRGASAPTRDQRVTSA